MEQCEDKIKCQRRVELRVSEIITCPRAQKGECGQPGQSFQNPESVFDQGQCDETKIDNEEVTQKNGRPLRDRLVREQVKRRRHGDRAKSERAGNKLSVHFSDALRPGAGAKKKCLESGEHRHENKDLVPGEIFFRNKEGRHPTDLHEDSSNRAENWKRIPAFPFRNRQQTNVEERDVNEKAEGMILSGGKQYRREKTAGNSEHRDDDRVQPNGQKNRVNSSKGHPLTS